MSNGDSPADEPGDTTNDRVDRRTVLGGITAGSLLLAGCSGSGGKTATATPTQSLDEMLAERQNGGNAPTPTSHDDEPFERRQPSDDLTRQMEDLDRGVVAYPANEGILVRWRLFGTEPRDLGFNVYRDGEKINDSPITGSTNYVDQSGSTDSKYAVAPVKDGTEGEKSKAVEAWDQNYKRIPVNRPPSTTEAGQKVTYHANDASVADLTGDGSFDIVQKWSPSNAKDNSQRGHTSNVYLDGYTMEGEQLWRIDLGPNIRAGAHYTPFQVYDFDGDGKAELAVRTSDGTTGASGTVIGDPDANYVNEDGLILKNPEYMTVFDGETGEILDTVDFSPAQGDICQWGDCWGNRGDRFLSATAYLDGERPSFVWGRGYYAKTMLTAYDFRDGSIEKRWTFDSEDGNPTYAGQGNHQMSIADVDYDGKDEIIYGAMALDHDGTGLYSTGWGHGDALHVSDFDPTRPGLEVFQIHEGTNIPYHATFREAETGELLWGQSEGHDTGRCMIADIDPKWVGAEAWATSGNGTYTAHGGEFLDDIPSSWNSGIWWTGDLHRELMDHNWHDDETYGVGQIHKWNPEEDRLERLVRFEGTRSNNWTKGNPCISGDLLGDWREEVIWREPDSSHLRLYATPYSTDHRLYTLMHDPQYRLAIAWQNSGYNQPPWPSFFIGKGMQEPPEPDIEPVSSDE